MLFFLIWFFQFFFSNIYKSVFMLFFLIYFVQFFFTSSYQLDPFYFFLDSVFPSSSTLLIPHASSIPIYPLLADVTLEEEEEEEVKKGRRRSRLYLHHHSHFPLLICRLSVCIFLEFFTMIRSRLHPTILMNPSFFSSKTLFFIFVSILHMYFVNRVTNISKKSNSAHKKYHQNFIIF